MTRRLFGTDGVRGVAGTSITAGLALALGEAATRGVGQTAVGASEAEPLPGSEVAEPLPGSEVAEALPGSEVAEAASGLEAAELLPSSEVAGVSSGSEAGAASRPGDSGAGTSDAQTRRLQVLILRDTRESGEMLEAALAAGVSAAGGDALLGGVLPTPAAPLLVRRYSFDLAAVISASHNPYLDNGIKLFGADGFKLSDAQERLIEDAIALPGGAVDGLSHPGSTDDPGERDARDRARSVLSPRGSDDGQQTPPPLGRIRRLHGAQEDYLRELHTRFAGLELTGVKVALDCANGATYEVGPAIFKRLGAEVSVIGGAPDGRNINAGCGSTHLDGLVELMRQGNHDIGFAFDGDGDRVLAVDRAGAIVDGDELMALIALHLRAAGRLPGDGVAVTVMTNFGFHEAMRKEGIAVAIAQVGDRYVLQELRARGWAFGGEQSGHLIEMGFNRSGDGIATALLTLEALKGDDLAHGQVMRRLPQRLLNVRVADAGRLAGCEAVAREIRRAEEELRERGRVLVRASGTEPLVRVMVEAPSEQEAGEACERIATLVERELGPAPA